MIICDGKVDRFGKIWVWFIIVFFPAAFMTLIPILWVWWFAAVVSLAIILQFTVGTWAAALFATLSYPITVGLMVACTYRSLKRHRIILWG